MATDGGNRTTSVEMSVTITNVKNQPPQWEKESYSVVIPENTARDTPIVVRGTVRVPAWVAWEANLIMAYGGTFFLAIWFAGCIHVSTFFAEMFITFF